MKVFGLTGGIGMGKSFAAQALAERGLPVIDTDVIAREIVEPGQPALAEITAAFGADILDGSGRLRRDELARRVFGNTAARQQLEAILHPRIREAWQNQIAQWRAGDAQAAVVVIPLLFETEAQSAFDAVICVACSSATQRTRLLERNWSAEQTSQRIAAQWPIEKKMERANFVVWSEGAPEVHRAQLERIVIV